MPFRVYVVDGRVETPGVEPTWKIRMELPFTSGDWGRKINSGVSGKSVEFDSRDVRVAGIWRQYVWPMQSWLAIEWYSAVTGQGSLIYAGLVTQVSYVWSTKRIRLSHVDIWKVLEGRIVTSDRTDTISSSKISWKNLSFGTLIKRIVQNVTSRLGSNMVYELPIVLPADVAGTEELESFGYSFDKADQLIKEIIEDDNGPDIDFRPRWSAQHTLEWVLEINSHHDLVWDYDLDTDQSSVVDLEYRIDGEALATRIYGAGEGTEKRTLTAMNAWEDTTYMAFEDSVKFSGLKSERKLETATLNNRRSRYVSVRQIDMIIRADGSPTLRELRLGGAVRWKADKDPFLVEGWHEWEIIEMRGSLTSENVSIATLDRLGPEGDH